MSDCKFIDKLNRLRKSSSDSIDNVDSFDSFKEYMHVVRNAENDLKVILRQVNAGAKKKLSEVPVSFEKMEETGEKVYELCAQFYEEQNKQGFGGGTMMEHIVSWSDIKGETTLTTSAVGAESPLEILKRVVRGDIHLYAKDGSFKSIPKGDRISTASKLMVGDWKRIGDYLKSIS